MLGVWLTPSHRTSMPFLYSLWLSWVRNGGEESPRWNIPAGHGPLERFLQSHHPLPLWRVSPRPLASFQTVMVYAATAHLLASFQIVMVHAVTHTTGVVSNCHGSCSDAHHWRRFKVSWFMQWRTPLPSFQTVMVHAVTRTTDRMLWPHKALSEHGFDRGGLVYVLFSFYIPVDGCSWRGRGLACLCFVVHEDCL